MRIDQAYSKVFIFVIWMLMAAALLQSHRAFTDLEEPRHP